MRETSYDPEADTFYARFVPEDVPIANTDEIAPGIMTDLDDNGDMVGIEVLSVSIRLAGKYGRKPALADANG